MSDEIRINEDDVRQHLRYLNHENKTEIIVFDKVKYPNGKIVWADNEDEKVKQVRYFNEIEKVDVYFGLRDRTGAGNKNVVSSNDTWVEIDEHDVEKPEELPKLKAFLDKNNIKPSLIGFSGGGYHVYVPHKKIDLRDNEIKEKYKNTLLAIRDVLLKSNIDIDKAVFDIQRVTRVMGSYNWRWKKMSKIVSYNECSDEDKENNFKTFGKLYEELPASKTEIGTVDENAVEILEKYHINETDKWLYDIISKGITINADTGGNSVFFKNGAICLVREELEDAEIRVVGQSLSELCEGRTLPAFFGWVNKAKSGQLAVEARDICPTQLKS